jgi:hypothetical protein
MSSDKDTTYPKNFLVRCDHCLSYSRLPEEISVNQFPLILSCPRCNNAKYLNPATRFPKIPPLPDIRDIFTISLPKADDEKSLATSEYIESEVEVPCFYATAQELGKLTVKLFEKLGELGQGIRNFEQEVGQQFLQLHEQSQGFAQAWQPAHLESFLNFPFISVPIPCEDELAEHYAAWIISPRFYNPLFGIPIESKGGFRLRLVNQYTRMSYYFPSWFCKELDFPESLELEVRGRKILGNSLSFCWKDIPGLIQDRDFSEEMVSVYMRNPLESRQWLAQHGISPWTAQSLRPEELNIRSVEENVFDQADFTEAWTKFAQYGHMGLWWDDEIQARRFATLVAKMMKGTTPVFIEGDKQRAAWQGLYTTMYDTVSHHSEMIFLHNADYFEWDALLKCKSIIVDLYGDLDTTTIEKLYQYEGHLLLLGRDPLMDFQTSNIHASLVHGLAGYSLYDVPEWEHWKGTQLSNKMPALAKALDSMRKVLVD